ncbi:helicase-like transcription factor CHR28 isoform X2 [Senna tora]|uniref:Helicase-like transcription factor CHR28 isoform X2 n=1 Tax=Senna tora TaxID=362788 RepID=A0A834SG97_9FABA|nr:helicase-like transcription factor CHR28 isoform X2 [Senna tora]
MVQKETSSLYCTGGILADDQGLGKTVSTIALILKERPSTLMDCHSAQKGELETLNLDADDDVLPESGGVKKETNICQDISSVCPIKNKNLLMQTKGRPSAGTLIVCPTSVLRQWAEELQNKVTSKANLSVLVYHGSNRTKDPHELAKYDVVLTTYSIVSMEVPKQPLVDKDDDEKGNSDIRADLPLSKKRKCPPSSSKGGKKGLDSALLEAAARPLAKVAWFRVVLDEAQSIKNHRTQVARACWGLRAKRRWCLSGTPIQNAIDDLYSYFRFLRYDPYAVYTTFCSTIKIPISRNPSKGYRKLQAVLKTIMLRRTKGTLLDGEPIISLPPKFVELKKVDFSDEERDFYSRLEADSRAQFQEYANAGTVKQNYVNILLMLLRLRQACDHPLLVKRYNSNSLWRSSVEMAKKLPREKQVSLLKCLEASLALCGICNDPPEDAVVSACGHVFCNQCICEHLTGDDNQCPAANCKVRLSMSSVFSKDTLSCSLSDQPSDSLLGCSGSEVEGYEPCSQSQPCDSSKIKAALEVLNSLTKPQGCASKNISMQINSEEHSDLHGNSPDASKESQKPSGDGSSNDSIVVREKAIVFSQWTRMLDLLEACLKNSSIQYRRLDGTMSVVARDKAVKDFNTIPEVTVMIMSLKAASLGLNMVAACHVLLLDLWWNPTTEDQAIDRAHRIGQTRPVTVLRLTVRDTVEDRILALQQKKRKMVASAFGEDGTGGRQSRLTVDDLKYLFMM